jgi:proline racemase
MYGCFVTPPGDDGAELGAVFFHQSGFSTACGHGTIALATWAVEAGLAAGRPLVHESIIGTRFEAWARSGGERIGGGASVVTDVVGSAFMTGLHQFVLDSGDPLGGGFTLP